MTFPFKLRLGKRTLRWSGGGLLVLLSIGLHGMLLAWPVPESSPPAPESLTELDDATAVIGVVRLPAAAEPAAEVVAAAPSPQATQAPPPQAPPLVRSVPPAPPTVPAPDQPVEARPEPPPPPAETLGLEPVPPESLPATLDDRLRDPAEYQFNQQAKSLATNDVAFHTTVVPGWLETESQGLGDHEIPVLGSKLAPLQVTSPITTCLTPAPAEGLVGVIVNAAGQLVKEPVLLDSTGYTVLDEKALELALGRSFEPPPGNSLPNPQAHWLPVQVRYSGDSCSP
ncbi:energy transducer TonB [Nodosilinea sp. PGN35]|uniref:energy transducer TonB family protein n=1 Tax=Nodosilinea sp. PGN35 TaxID=3020489 RepID=UPI0023B22F6D|nr:energy transducer TonB [Nodosilinea sp. TSF1-S3]MDF0366624.1 energy transducer TonB [Nodosilinea sp. TSF1-S3]